MINTKKERITIERLSLTGDLFDLSPEELKMYNDYEEYAIRIMTYKYNMYKNPIYDPIDDYEQMARLLLCDCIKTYKPSLEKGSFAGYLSAVISKGYIRHISRAYNNVKMTNKRENRVVSLNDTLHDNAGDRDSKEIYMYESIKDNDDVEQEVLDRVCPDKSSTVIILDAIKDIANGVITKFDRYTISDTDKRCAQLMLRGYTSTEISNAIEDEFKIKVCVGRNLIKIKRYVLKKLHEENMCMNISEKDKSLGIYNGRKVKEILFNK